MKANHNASADALSAIVVVKQIYKNWNWKQITTTKGYSSSLMPLLSKFIRTEIESKSQPITDSNTLKCVVKQIYKNWNWKQITTPCLCGYKWLELLSKFIRTEIESKSQQLPKSIYWFWSC